MGASFKQLIVWQRAVELSVAVYHLTSSFPKAEQFGLTSQLRRASVSVASNIAEGYGRSSRGEYLLFLGHARGSISELQTRLIIASSLNFSPPESHASAEKLSEDVSRLLNALIDKLRVKSRTWIQDCQISASIEASLAAAGSGWGRGLRRLR